jgi:hypothetical protein
VTSTRALKSFILLSYRYLAGVAKADSFISKVESVQGDWNEVVGKVQGCRCVKKDDVNERKT